MPVVTESTQAVPDADRIEPIDDDDSAFDDRLD